MRMCQVFIFLKSRYLSVSCCLRNDYIFYNFFYRKNTISITLQISVNIYKACKEQDDLTVQTLLFFSFLCFFFIGAHQCMYQASLNKKKYDKYKNSYDLGPDHLLMPVTENSRLLFSSSHLQLVIWENNLFCACYFDK